MLGHALASDRPCISLLQDRLPVQTSKKHEEVQVSVRDYDAAGDEAKSLQVHPS